MGIKIGNDNKLKNVTIAEKIEVSDKHKAENKKLAERHPILTGLFCSLVVGIWLMFSFWQDIVSFIECNFLR